MCHTSFRKYCEENHLLMSIIKFSLLVLLEVSSLYPLSYRGTTFSARLLARCSLIQYNGYCILMCRSVLIWEVSAHMI